MPQEAWDDICLQLGRAIGSGRAVDGAMAAIDRVGGMLAEHFPPATVNDNELPDAPVVL